LSENSAQWAATGQVPIRNSVREDPALGDVAAPIAAVAPSAENAVLLPQVPQLEGALWDNFGPAVDAVLMGEQADVQAALDQAAQNSQQMIDENAELFGSSRSPSKPGRAPRPRPAGARAAAIAPEGDQRCLLPPPKRRASSGSSRAPSHGGAS